METQVIKNTNINPAVMMQPILLADSKPIQYFLSEDSTSGKLILSGEVARSGVPTENGRVYPREIWEKQISKLRSALKARKVYGESEHPCLKDPNFKVFTVNGWKNFLEITKADKIWSRVNGKAVLSNVEDIINEPYSGEIYDISTATDLKVSFTPQHRFFVLKRPELYDNKEYYVTTEEIYKNRFKYSHDMIPRVAKFNVEKTSKIVIPGVEQLKKSAHKDVSKPLILDAKSFSAFMGIYLAEGSVSNSKSTKDGIYKIEISQVNAWSKNYIFNEILKNLHPELKWNESKNGFYCADKRLHSYLSNLGNKYTKFVPNEIKALDNECLREFLFWYTIGDGRISECSQTDAIYKKWKSDNSKITFKQFVSKETRYNDDIPVRWSLSTVSEKLIYDLLECLIKTGKTGVISQEITKKDYLIEGRTIKAENKVPLFTLKVIKNNGNLSLDSRALKITKNFHSGNIYCLKTTYGNFMMEKNGVSFWTGNSSGKTSLKNVSHIMTDLRINDDGIVIGTMEILPTTEGKNLEAILRSNVPIGVSSRGFGSTIRNDRGEEVVQDDFQLITFDFVADPADPTAFPKIISENKNIKHIFEGKGFEMNSTTEEQMPLADEINSAKNKALAKKWAQMINDELNAENSDEEAMKESILNRLGDIRLEMLEDVKEELRKDTNFIAEAIKTVLDKKIIIEDKNDTKEISALVEAKENEIVDLRSKLSKKDLEIGALKEDIDSAGKLLKKLGFQAIMEKNISGHEDAELIRSTMGDLTKFDNSKDLVESLDYIKTQLKVKKDKQKKLIEQKERLLAADREQQAKLQEQINTLSEALTKSIEANKHKDLYLYAVDQLVGNPNARKIMSIIESTNVRSSEEIDKIISKYGEVRRDKETSEQIKAKIRNVSGAALNPIVETRSKSRQTLLDTGLSIDEYQNLISGKKAF